MTIIKKIDAGVILSSLVDVMEKYWRNFTIKQKMINEHERDMKISNQRNELINDTLVKHYLETNFNFENFKMLVDVYNK